MMENPCYNTLTRTDCPNRSSGCAVNCPKWAKYVKERDENYEKRALDNREVAFTHGHVQRIRKRQRAIRDGFWRK